MIDIVLMAGASLLLVLVNGLAFHDLAEPHTVRDWPMLIATALVFFAFGRVISRHRAGPS